MYISVGVVFMPFTAIILFHTIEKLKTPVQKLVTNNKVVRRYRLERGSYASSNLI